MFTPPETAGTYAVAANVPNAHVPAIAIAASLPHVDLMIVECMIAFFFVFVCQMGLRDRKGRKGQSSFVPCDPLSANAREARCKASKTGCYYPPPEGDIGEEWMRQNASSRVSCAVHSALAVSSLLLWFHLHILYQKTPRRARGKIKKVSLAGGRAWCGYQIVCTGYCGIILSHVTIVIFSSIACATRSLANGSR